jgi:hypothetical protein
MLALLGFALQSPLFLSGRRFNEMIVPALGLPRRRPALPERNPLCGVVAGMARPIRSKNED